MVLIFKPPALLSVLLPLFLGYSDREVENLLLASRSRKKENYASVQHKE